MRHKTNNLYAHSPLSSASLAGKAGFGCLINSSSLVAVASSIAGRWCDGVIGEHDIPTAASEPVEVLAGGIVNCVAGGTVTGGDSVTLDAAGEWVVATAGQEASGYVTGGRNDSHANGTFFWMKWDRHIATSATIPTLVAGAEASNAIPVTFAGPAEIAQYRCDVYDAAFLQEVVAAYTLAETGTGAEVSTTAKASLVFTTDAAGAAIITVSDVSTTSTETLFVVVSPFPSQGTVPAIPGPVEVTITFA